VRELLAAQMEHVVAGGAQLGARPMQREIHRLALRVLERRDGLAPAEGLEADETELALRRKPSAAAEWRWGSDRGAAGAAPLSGVVDHLPKVGAPW
jgi:hypothetical protein